MSARPVVYEVALSVDVEVAEEYRRWLAGHVEEILALPGFLDAQVFAVLDPPPAPGSVALCVHYRLRDAAAFETYLAEHAPRLRADGRARFGDRFQASRRLLRPQPLHGGEALPGQSSSSVHRQT